MAKDFATDISNVLKEYVADANRIIEDSARDAAEICTRQLKNTSPKGKGKGKRYANGWSVKSKQEGHLMSFIVYNKAKPGLTHLLEYGHVIRNKKGTYGRTKPIKHIQPAEEAAAHKFELRVRARLRSLR